MASMCFTAFRPSILVVIVYPFPVHILLDMVMLRYSDYYSKRKGQGTVCSVVYCVVIKNKKKLLIHRSIKLWTRNWSDTITVKHEALLLSIFLLSREWPRQNFSLLYLYNIMQTSNENKKISIMGLLIELKPKLSKLTWWESFARQ